MRADTEKGKEALRATPATAPVTDSLFDPLPPSLFSLLPDPLQRLAAYFPVAHERDLLLLSMLPTMAAASPNTIFRYGKEWMHLNMYVCAVAEAAGGKGAAKTAKRTIDPLDEMLKAMGMGPPDENVNSGLKCLIAGDTSAAAVKRSLRAANHGIIFETEIKAVAEAINSDWGGWRSVLLNSFQNEKISVERADADGTGVISFTIAHPALSIMMTGTPGSFEDIIQDSEDGAFSRFVFYRFEPDAAWVNQFTDEAEDATLETLVSEIAEEFKTMFIALREREKALVFKVKKADQIRINSAGQASLDLLKLSGADPNLAANIKRAAVVTIRIAALLTLYEHMHEGRALSQEVKSLECNAQYVTIGLQIAFTLIEHALQLSDMLTVGSHKLREDKHEFLAQLPMGTFTLKNAYDIAKTMGYEKQRTVRHWLTRFTQDAHLEHKEHGIYVKKVQPTGFTPHFRTSVLFDQNGQLNV